MNTLSVRLADSQPIETKHVFVVRTEGELVVMFIDDKRLELGTVLAYETGAKMATLANTATDGMAVLFTVNNESVYLPADKARQVGVALCRKADTADEFQKKGTQLRIIK